MLNFNSLYLSVHTYSNLIPIFDASCSIRMIPPQSIVANALRQNGCIQRSNASRSASASVK